VSPLNASILVSDAAIRPSPNHVIADIATMLTESMVIARIKRGDFTA
jgi:hypothetical protein